MGHKWSKKEDPELASKIISGDNNDVSSKSNNELYKDYIMIWIDEYADDTSMKESSEKINELVKIGIECSTFQSADMLFDDRTRDVVNGKKLILILSPTNVTKEFFEKMETYSMNIYTKILLCPDNRKDKSKVEYSDDIFVCHKSIILPSFILRRINQDSSFDVYNTMRDLKTERLIFYSDQVFLTILKDMTKNPNAAKKLRMTPEQESKRKHEIKKIMINECSKYYEKNTTELKNIQSFLEIYDTSDAIHWYTRKTFFIEEFQSALTGDDVGFWYLFRYCITDIRDELTRLHEEQKDRFSEPFTVYRGRFNMTNREFEKISKNTGNFISSHGFWSTSLDEAQAIKFSHAKEDPLNFSCIKRILYEITVDPKLKSVIYASIEHLSEFPHEKEVLFDIGTVFKIEDVYQDKKYEKGDLRRIKLTATDEFSQECKNYIDPLIKQMQDQNKNLFYARRLMEMEKLEQAENYLKLMVQTLEPQNHDEIAFVYDELGKLKLRQMEWKSAKTYLDKALDIKTKKFRSNHPDFGSTYNDLGSYYQEIGDINEALKCYEKAYKLEKNRKAVTRDNMTIANINLARIHTMRKDLQKAKKYCQDAARNISNVSWVVQISYQTTLADVALMDNKIDIAEKYYKDGLKMAMEHLPPSDQFITYLIKDLADVYAKKHDYELGLKFLEEKLKYYENVLTKDHINLALLHMKIGDLSIHDQQQQIKSYKKAVHILQKSSPSQSSTMANCLMLLGSSVEQQGNYREALGYYDKVLQIRKEILPEDHTDIALVYSCIGFIQIKLQQFQNATENLERSRQIYSARPQGSEHIQNIQQTLTDIQNRSNRF